MAAILIVLNFFFVALFAQQLAQVKLFRCSHAIGLIPWASVWDSRLPTYPVACSDGRRPVEIILAPNSNTFSLTIRSLQKQVTRQGVIVQFQLTSAFAQLVGFCISDTPQTSGSTLTANNAAPYVSNTCGGGAASTTGSPQFTRETDDSIFRLQGWSIRNPPPKDPTGLAVTISATGTYTQSTTLGKPTGGCNFYYAWNFQIDQTGGQTLMGPTVGLASSIWRPVYNSGFADAAGLDYYRGLQRKEAGIVGGVTSPVAPCQWTSFDASVWGSTIAAQKPYAVRGVSWAGSPLHQLYGGTQTVLVSYAAAPLTNPVGPADDPTQTGVGRTGQSGTGNVMYANFFPGPVSLIGFQLRCLASKENEEKYVTISFFGRSPIGSYAPTESPFQLNYPEPSSTATLQQWNANSSPNTVIGSIYIKATCQNVATSTPTPPLYPFNYKFPITPGTPNTASLTIQQCEYQCEDRDFQERLIRAVQAICLEQGNHGCSLLITCQLSVKCFEVLSTTELPALTRRGLQQATRTSWLMTIVVSAYAVQTVQLVATRLRAASLFPWISPFSALKIVWYTKTGGMVSVPFNTPSTAVPITSFPSVVAPWTGACYVYGSSCSTTPCAAQCNNGPVRKITSYSTGDIFCSCNTCQADIKRTSYVFTSLDCGTSKDQTTADVCCWNVMQDVVCWALDNPGVVAADKDTVPSWTYRPPSIGNINPTKPTKTDGPKTCPSSAQSPKGLLGLLGLLGLIPLCICCLLLLLCLLRRKKREGDVHFATFDPNAAAPCATACSPCPSIPAM